MDGERAGTRRRPRLGLRGMIVLLLAVAAGLTALRPLVREPLRSFERYARIRLSAGDMDRHLEDGRGVAERFAAAFRSGRLEEARELMTADFRERTGPGELSEMAGRSPLGRRPSELVRDAHGFSDARGGWVSEYVFRCGDGGELVSLVLVTEAGRLRVDRILRKEPTEVSPP